MGFLDRLFAVAGALLVSQVPLFIQHYTQQLSGHVSELHHQVEIMRATALKSDKTLEQFIQKFLGSSDIDFVRQGEIMQTMVHRLNSLSESFLSLKNATVFTRPFTFLGQVNMDIANSTLQSFSIGIPLNMEGLTYALVGIVIGYLIFLCIRNLTLSLFYSIRKVLFFARKHLSFN